MFAQALSSVALDIPLSVKYIDSAYDNWCGMNRVMKMAKDWLKQMLGRMFPPISRSAALRIASEALAINAQVVPQSCHGTKPDNCRIYNAPPEPCWYIYAPWSDQKDVIALRSSRVILVGKLTGVVHYDGSAGDEG